MTERNINTYHPSSIILFVIGSLGLGGAEKQMALLIKHLGRMNFNCHLFALEPFGPLKNQLRTTGVKLHNGGYFSEKSTASKIYLIIRDQIRLCRVIRKIDPDIIHAYLPLTNFMGSLAGRIPNVPMIVTSKRALGTHQDRNWGWRLFDMASFRFSHHVTVNSKAVAADTIARDMGDVSKIKLIYNGLELDNFTSKHLEKSKVREALHLDPDKKIIIVVANLIPYKGHVELLKAASLVSRHFYDSLFLLVGEDRGIQKNLEKLASELGIVNNIMFMGQRNDVSDLMVASDVSVLPSHEEGFSNVVLESMAACLPVVATRVGGNPEAIIDGETGWLVAPGKPEELAMKIMDLLEDPQKAEKWGEAGRRRVEQNFSCEKMVAEFVKLYCKTER